MGLPVSFTGGSLNISCYPDNVQTLADLIVSVLQGEVAFSLGGVIYSETEPAAEYRGNTGWFNLVDYKLYFWNSTYSAWAREYDVPASGNERRIWVGTEADLKTYDGGADAAISASTGPFWEIDTNFAAKFPMGAGTLPVSATVVGVGDTGGEEKHVLTVSEMQHFHGVGTDGQTDDPFAMLHRTWNTAPTTYPQRVNDMNPTSASGWHDDGNISSGVGGTTKALADETVDGHNTLPPYRAVYFIKRTARIWVFA